MSSNDFPRNNFLKPQTSNLKPPIVDLHVHLFPDRMFEAVWSYFESFDWAVHRESVSDIAKTLAAHGVTLAAGLTYPHRTGIAHTLNEFMESVGREFPIFRPFACVHPEDTDFRECVDYALASPNLHGFKFQPLVQKFDVNHPRLDYLYSQCLERKTPIVMHIGSGPYANEYVGVPHFRKLMSRFPALRICVPHMGVPEFDDFLRMLDDYPEMHLDTTMINVRTSLFDTAWKGDVEALLRHSDRICFGSDWPNVPYPYQEALDSVARFGFPPETLPKIYGANALRFLDANKE